MKNTLQHVKEAKEKLCEKILKVAERNKTPDWKMKDLELVLKHLKKQKSRDPLGLPLGDHPQNNNFFFI